MRGGGDLEGEVERDDEGVRLRCHLLQYLHRSTGGTARVGVGWAGLALVPRGTRGLGAQRGMQHGWARSTARHEARGVRHLLLGDGLLDRGGTTEDEVLLAQHLHGVHLASVHLGRHQHLPWRGVGQGAAAAAAAAAAATGREPLPLPNP